MIPLSTRKQCHEKRIARTASRRIWLTPERMTGGVNQKCAMLEHYNFCNAANEKTTERADPSIPQEPCQCWQDEADYDGEKMNMSMLPHDQRIFL